jgi:phosphoribosylformylglycinamidine (FGAM) synthase-like enzyme
VLLIGPIGSKMGASHYLSVVHGRKEGRPPRLDFDLELGVQRTLLDLIHRGYVKSAHDCSEGGLAVALAEACISGEQRIGASLQIDATGLRPDQVLFNESQSRVIATVGKDYLAAVEQLLAETGAPFRWLGDVGGETLSITIADRLFEWDIAELYDSWYFAIERMMAW